MKFSPVKFFVSLLLLAAASGCVSFPDYRPDLPEDLGNNGLVVGQVVGIGRLRNWSMYTDVLVNDRKKGRVVNGFIAFPLSAGEYELSGLYNETYGGSSSYGGYTVTTKYTTTLPLKRKFTVRPKQVTNVGLIVLYPDPGDKEQKKFMRLYVDNTQDMKQFLRTGYPLLAAKMPVDAMTLAPGDLMPANLLEALRKEIAVKEVNLSGGYAAYVAGDVGTLAEVQRDKDNKVSGVKLIEVPTVASLQSESPNFVKDRFAFLTKNNRLFTVQNGKAAEKRAPEGLRAGRVFVFGSSDMVIVDDKFEIYTSTNNGDRWQANLAHVTDKKMSAKVSPGSDGYYAYIANPPAVLYGGFGKPELKSLALPPDMKSLGLFREKPAGLFAERETSFYKETEKRPFFFRPKGKTLWEMRTMPAANCEHIRFADSEGLNLSTQCGETAVGGGGPRFQYASTDGGKTWQRK